MINKNAKASANDYKESEDVARFKVKPAKTAAPETFTIDFSDLTANGAKYEHQVGKYESSPENWKPTQTAR